MQATTSSRVYGAILANQGITAREINKMLGTAQIGGTLNSLIKRGAIIAMPGSTERNTKYFKGRAAVAFKQPAGGLTQKQIEANAIAAAKREVANSITMLQGVMKQLEKATQ